MPTQSKPLLIASDTPSKFKIVYATRLFFKSVIKTKIYIVKASLACEEILAREFRKGEI